MKRLYNILVITILTVSGLPFTVNAASLKLADTSLHSGMVYIILWLNDAPNEVSRIRFGIPYNRDLIGISGSGPEDIGLLKNNVSQGTSSWVSSPYPGYFSYDATLIEPIPRGSSGPLLKIPVVFTANTDIDLSLTDLDYDIKAWITESAHFTYIEELNEPPQVEAGPDRVVFNTVTLDDTQSFDFDGMIVFWEWSLIHRRNSAFNQFATGKTAVITRLATGVYDVVLTATDNTGLTATDLMVLSVAGWTAPGDANMDGKIGLEDVILNLQVLTGR